MCSIACQQTSLVLLRLTFALMIFEFGKYNRLLTYRTGIAARHYVPYVWILMAGAFANVVVHT